MSGLERFPSNKEEQEPIPAADRELAIFLAQEINSLSHPGLTPEEHARKKKFCLEEAKLLMAKTDFTDPEARAILQASIDQFREA